MSNKNIKNADLVAQFPKATNAGIIVLAKEAHKSNKSVTFFLAQYTDNPISYSGLANNASSSTSNTSYKGKKTPNIPNISQTLNAPTKTDAIVRAIVNIKPEKVDELTSMLANNLLEIVDVHGFCHSNENERPYYIKDGEIVILQQKLHKNPTNNQILCAIDADGKWLVTKNQMVIQKSLGFKNTAVNDENYDMLGLTWIEESELAAQIKFEHEYHVKMSSNTTPSVGLLSTTEEQVSAFG